MRAPPPLRPAQLRLVLQLSVLTLMLAWLPMLGIDLGGLDAERYLEPALQPGGFYHAPFSWPVFLGLSMVVVAGLVPFAISFLRYRPPPSAGPRPRRPFPWWGWLGLVALALSWLLAWARLPWFAALQRATFLPLWGSYIVVLCALTRQRRRRCFASDHPLYFALLFPVSAIFWWFFEYLNRFVGNWSYSIADFATPMDVLLHGLLPFATILPAVLCTAEWLASFPRMAGCLKRVPAVRLGAPRLLGVAGLVLAGLGLTMLGVWPDYLFPLLWLAPLFILLALQALLGQPTVFAGVARGDWRVAGTFGLGALVCGFFWEMWNLLSLAKWQYAIPFVDRFQLFEMPVLGYSGYPPFGLECAVVIHLLVGGRLWHAFADDHPE